MNDERDETILSSASRRQGWVVRKVFRGSSFIGRDDLVLNKRASAMWYPGYVPQDGQSPLP